MAKICDGCDAKEDVEGGLKAVKVTVHSEEAERPPVPGNYDLCGACLDKLHDTADPTTWPRKRKPRAPKAG
jgi:hypothetical protein